MSVKAILYCLVLALSLWATDSININNIFKKNKIEQARIFYLMMNMALAYLVTNFLYDFFINSSVF